MTCPCSDRMRFRQPCSSCYSFKAILGLFLGAGEAAEAILPCSWRYCESGQMFASRATPNPQPSYARWIETYNSAELAEQADRLRSFVDRMALESGPQELARMERAFMRSSQLEYMFWDAAYRLEEWPV